MTPSERLSLAIHLESAAIAPRTSDLIEAGKEALREIERLRAALDRIDDAIVSDSEAVDLQSIASNALHQQLIPEKE